MSSPRHIAILAFAGVQILDVAGAASVFAAANDAQGSLFYKVHILSAEGGVLHSSSAVELSTQPIGEVSASDVDTLLIAGGDHTALMAMAHDKVVQRWAIKACGNARRYGSICTGTFALAHFGLLRGKRVATHWSTCSQLSAAYPDTEVDVNALYVNDGNIWTSAGVTTGIDMSLEMVAADLGGEIANAIAKRLVLYARRPGYQSQFSPVLDAQMHADAPFSALIHWMHEHLSETLDVPRLAARVAMSERTFLRKFTRSTGTTPARFVETLRLDHTRSLLALGISLKEIAAKTGYSTPSQLSKAFDRRFGMTPLLFRELHCRHG
jgi:transcriptional regulator GlxA family with amidase domain